MLDAKDKPNQTGSSNKIPIIILSVVVVAIIIALGVFITMQGSARDKRDANRIDDALKLRQFIFDYKIEKEKTPPLGKITFSNNQTEIDGIELDLEFYNQKDKSVWILKEGSSDKDGVKLNENKTALVAGSLNDFKRIKAQDFSKIIDEVVVVNGYKCLHNTIIGTQGIGVSEDIDNARTLIQESHPSYVSVIYSYEKYDYVSCLDTDIMEEKRDNNRRADIEELQDFIIQYKAEKGKTPPTGKIAFSNNQADIDGLKLDLKFYSQQDKSVWILKEGSGSLDGVKLNETKTALAAGSLNDFKRIEAQDFAKLVDEVVIVIGYQCNNAVIWDTEEIGASESADNQADLQSPGLIKKSQDHLSAIYATERFSFISCWEAELSAPAEK